MIVFHDKIEKKDLGKGVILQVLGQGRNMNVLHWNMADGSEVKLHTHPEEQFGYVIKGGFDFLLGGESYQLKAGDAYFVPPDVPHSFVAVGETEAIDIFSPVKKDLPWLKG